MVRMGFMRFSMRVLFYFAVEFGAPERYGRLGKREAKNGEKAKNQQLVSEKICYSEIKAVNLRPISVLEVATQIMRGGCFLI